MADNTLLEEAVKAVREGDKARARDLLTRLIKTQPDNAENWIWLSAVVETEKERLTCLREALRADPQNEAARRGLILFGAMPPDPSRPAGIGLPHRKWTARMGEPPRLETPEFKITRTRLYAWGGAGLLSIALLIFGIIDSRPRPVIVPTLPNEAPTARASATFLPTRTPEFIPPTATYPGAPPLVSLLSATYTPTPIYGATPHPISEAFQAGLRQMASGDWDGALSFFQQVVQSEPQAGDAYYYLGEAYRLKGDPDTALKQYNLAAGLMPNYAPIYLGRARAKLAKDANANVEAELTRAVQLDQQYGEAFLDLIAYYLHKGDAQKALAYVPQAMALESSSPLVFLYQAQANLAAGNAAFALESARKASAMDITSLDAYRILAAAMQANQLMSDSLTPLGTYLTYRPDDTAALLMEGKAYTSLASFDKAIVAYSHALEVDPRLFDALLARGQVYLTQNQPGPALADFNAAQQINPKSFDVVLGKGQAFFMSNKNFEAYQQFEYARPLANSDLQRATAAYWDALSLEALNRPQQAVPLWQAILALPPEAVPVELLSTAQAHLNAILTPSPEPEVTPSPAA